jgi:hypothetical protein
MLKHVVGLMTPATATLAARSNGHSFDSIGHPIPLAGACRQLRARLLVHCPALSGVSGVSGIFCTGECGFRDRASSVRMEMGPFAVTLLPYHLQQAGVRRVGATRRPRAGLRFPLPDASGTDCHLIRWGPWQQGPHRMHLAVEGCIRLQHVN